jgi:hypothetical protein
MYRTAQGEAIIPAGQNREGGDTVLNFYGDIVANNPEELIEQLERRLQTTQGVPVCAYPESFEAETTGGVLGFFGGVTIYGRRESSRVKLFQV